MNILVTGGAGFVGSHCALALMNSGYNVIIFDNLSTGHKETIESLSKYSFPGRLMEFFKGDLTDMNDLDRVFTSYHIDGVMHFAAFSQISESINEPTKYYRNNVVGTLNLLDAMNIHNVRMIIFSSSAAIYGEPKYTPIDEKHPQNPMNPYGYSKLIIERIMDDYDKTYDIRSVRLRYFNVVGADAKGRIGEWHEPETHLIPNIIKSALGDERVLTVFGTDYPTHDGTCIRDYINIEDVADAHINALKYLENGGKTDYFNLGTNHGSSVKEVFDLCERIIGKTIPIKIDGRRPGDQAVLIADNKKAKDTLKWEPKRNLEDSIRTAFMWEKANNHFNN